MHDEMLERALEFAANCFSSYTKASDIQKKMLNQLFFEKVLISSKGEKEHHAHAHLNTWTLIFRTNNVAQNEAIEIEHRVEEYLDLDLDEDLETSAETAENTGSARSEDLAISDNSLNRMCKNTMVLDLPLKSLLLRNIKTVDFEGIQYLPLQQLCLVDLESTDLSPLTTPPTLRVVREENVERLLNVEALGALPALETVALDSAEVADGLGSVHSLELPRHLRLETAVDLINRVSADDPLEISCVTGAS